MPIAAGQPPPQELLDPDQRLHFVSGKASASAGQMEE